MTNLFDTGQKTWGQGWGSVRKGRVPWGYEVVGSLLGAAAIVLGFSRTEVYSGHADAVDGPIYYMEYGIRYFPREIRTLVGRESSLSEPRIPGTST